MIKQENENKNPSAQLPKKNSEGYLLQYVADGIDFTNSGSQPIVSVYTKAIKPESSLWNIVRQYLRKANWRKLETTFPQWLKVFFLWLELQTITIGKDRTDEKTPVKLWFEMHQLAINENMSFDVKNPNALGHLISSKQRLLNASGILVLHRHGRRENFWSFKLTREGKKIVVNLSTMRESR